MSRGAWLVAAALFAAALPRGPAEPGPCPPLRGAARLLCGEPLDLNRAAPADLEALPGIGPARARALAEARPFARLEDARAVPGIGPRILAGLRPFVAVGVAAGRERAGSAGTEAGP